MKKVSICDMTLLNCANTLSFKDKIEIVRHLDTLKTDVIYMPEIKNEAADTLLIRTVSAFVKNSTLCALTGLSEQSIEKSYMAVKGAKKKRLAISLPVSAIQMEYFLHKKPQKTIELLTELVEKAKERVDDVEFLAQDSTRAEPKFLKEIIEKAIELGVKTITICDDEGVMLPDEFKQYVENLYKQIPQLGNVRLGILCKDTNKMAISSAVLGARAGADEVKCAIGNCDVPNLDTFCGVISNCGNRCNCKTDISFTELHRITNQITWILGENKGKNSCEEKTVESEEFAKFSSTDSQETIFKAVGDLGYDISVEDEMRVYEEFKRVAEKKTVTLKDLDAIIASVALQVPPIYKLISYVINNGNIITSSAQIKLEKDGKEYSGIAIGDGPIDASFNAIEQILGRKFELDDFQIQAVTEGKEAVGSALVKIRNNGKLYSANGISTDIIGASIRAYVNAVNKIVFEEEN